MGVGRKHITGLAGGQQRVLHRAYLKGVRKVFRFLLGFVLGGLVATMLVLWYVWWLEEKSAPDHLEK